MTVKDKEIKDPDKEAEASLKVLKVLAAISAGMDTATMAPFAGKQGIDKIRNTKFDADSILENQVEGTDVAENFGLEPGGLPAYIAGTTLDYVNPIALIASAFKVPGAGAKVTRELGEYLSKSAFKDKLGKKLAPELVPQLKKIAQAAEDTKVTVPRLFGMGSKEVPLRKVMKNPNKALDVLRGKGELRPTGGAYSVNQMVREEGGELNKAGRQIESTVKDASPKAKKINRAEIHRKKVAEAEAHNADDTKFGKIDVDALDSKIKTDLKPYTKVKVPEPKVPEVKEDSLSVLEEVLARKKAERDAKYFTPSDVPPPVPRVEPPPVPTAYDELGFEDIIARIADHKAAKEVPPAKVIPKFEYKDKHSSVEDMWNLRKEIDGKIEQRSWAKAMMDEPQRAEQEYLIKMRSEIDDEIKKSLDRVPVDGGSAAEKYAKDKDSYQNLRILDDVAEADALAKARGEGSRIGKTAISETGRMAGSGGSSVPFSLGRLAGEAVTGGKDVLGSILSHPVFGQAASELPGEILESPYDKPYMKDKTDRTEDAEFDMSTIPEEPKTSDVSMEDDSRSPASVVHIPEAEQAEEVMDMSSIPEEPIDPIHQKMDHVLDPGKPVWDPYINEEVLNTFLPRDSKRIIANPAALMAKVQQVAPNQVAVVQEMLDNDPDGMSEAGPKIAMMFPTMFEKDKYGAFDGKIIDPMMQQKFLSDLAQDEEMDTIEKSRLAMKVQRGESIHS